MSGFDRLQALHEQGVEHLLDDRLDELTPGMRALTVLFAVLGTVENGGFAAALEGPWDHRMLDEAAGSARLIGADAHARVFERVRALDLTGEASDLCEEDAARLEALDEELFALPQIDPALEAYVDAHPEEFTSA